MEILNGEFKMLDLGWNTFENGHFFVLYYAYIKILHPKLYLITLYSFADLCIKEMGLH
jgi:hypothetical protein